MPAVIGRTGPNQTDAPAAIATQGARVDHTDGDKCCINRALEVTREGKNEPGASPLERTMALDGLVVARGHNEAASHPDLMANAERLTIRRACAAHGRDDLRGVTPNSPWHVYGGEYLEPDRSGRVPCWTG